MSLELYWHIAERKKIFIHSRDHNKIKIKWFYNSKSVFPAVNASLRWFNNAVGALSLGFLASYWSAGFGRFLQVMYPCFPVAGGLSKFYAIAREKRPTQRQLLLAQYKQQANPLLSIPSIAHISTPSPFFRKTVVFSKICLGSPPSKFLGRYV